MNMLTVHSVSDVYDCSVSMTAAKLLQWQWFGREYGVMLKR